MPGPGMAAAGVADVTVGLWEEPCGVRGVGKSSVLALCGITLSSAETGSG